MDYCYLHLILERRWRRKCPIGKFYVTAGEGEETRIREKEKKERRERRWTAGGQREDIGESRKGGVREWKSRKKKEKAQYLSEVGIEGYGPRRLKQPTKVTSTSVFLVRGGQGDT